MRLRILFAPFLLVILFAFMFLLSIPQLQAKEEALLTSQAHSENVESEEATSQLTNGQPVIDTANQSESTCDNNLVPDGVGDGAVSYTNPPITADYVREAICAAYLRNEGLLGNPRDNGSGNDVHWWRDHQGNASDYQVQDFKSYESGLGAIIIFNPYVRTAFVVRDGIWNHYAYTLDGVNGSLGGPVTDEMEYEHSLFSYPIHYFMKGFIIWEWEPDDQASAIMYDSIPSNLQKTDTTFRDVPEDHLFYEFIKNIEEQGIPITRGCYDDQEGNRFFCPERPITRGELALMLARVLYTDEENLPEPKNPKFNDSRDAEIKFRRAAEMLALDKIVEGYNDHNRRRVFGYNEFATRAHAITMIIRALDVELPDDQPQMPTDINGHKFETEIRTAITYQISDGYGNNTFRPDLNASRGAVAKFLCRAFLSSCDGSHNNDLRENSWLYMGPGIKVIGDDEPVRIAEVSLDHPLVRIEVADHHLPGYSIPGDDGDQLDLFVRHTLPDLAKDHASYTQGNSGGHHSFVSINGTSFGCEEDDARFSNFPKHILELPLGYSQGESILKTHETTYFSDSATSFFRYPISGDLPEIFSSYDSRCPANGIPDVGNGCQSSNHGEHEWTEENYPQLRVEINRLLEESKFAVGYPVWNTIVFNGEIVRHPHISNEYDALGGAIGKTPKTAIGLSQDATRMFMATADRFTSINGFAQELIDAGAEQAILLDGGGSSQFYSYGTKEITQLRTSRPGGCGDPLYIPIFQNDYSRWILNAVVASTLVERVRHLTINPDSDEEYSSLDGVTFAFDSDSFLAPASVGNSQQTTLDGNAPYTLTLHYVPQPTTSTYPLQSLGRFYTVSANFHDNSPATLQDSYTVTVSYNGYRLPSTVSEANLALYSWNGSEWEEESTSVVDFEKNRVIATPNKLGFWALLASPSLALRTTTLSYAGSHDNPTKIILHVSKPVLSLRKDDFSVKIEGSEARIITLYEGSNEYILEVLPPTQSTDGLYDLEVSATVGGITVSDLEQDAVLYSESNNIDVALVIDRSGSMGIDYMQSAKNAAKQFVDFMFDNDQVGVVSFSNLARVDFGLAPVTSGAGGSREQAKNAIDALASGGGTSIGGGLEKGQNELTSKGDATHPWAMVLLSDGEQNQEPMVADVLPDIVTTKTIVHTVALGPQSDQALLLDIATQTGGTYNLAPTAEQLQEVYNTIAGTVSGQQALLTQTGIVRTGETDEKSVVVDSTISEATFSVRWSNSASNLELELTAPDGTVINPTVSASTSDMVYVSGSTYAYYRIKSPTLSAGVWKMKITGGIISGRRARIHGADPEEQYTAEVTGQPIGAAVTINSYFDDGTTYQTDDPILVSITLSDDQPIRGAEVVAIVGPLLTGSSPARTVDQQSDPILVLYDDGAHRDGQANDGVYANVLGGDNTETPGLYTFQIFATGTANNGESFARRTQQNVNVGVSPNPISANREADGLTYFLPLIMD